MPWATAPKSSGSGATQMFTATPTPHSGTLRRAPSSVSTRSAARSSPLSAGK